MCVSSEVRCSTLDKLLILDTAQIPKPSKLNSIRIETQATFDALITWPDLAIDDNLNICDSVSEYLWQYGQK